MKSPTPQQNQTVLSVCPIMDVEQRVTRVTEQVVSVVLTVTKLTSLLLHYFTTTST